MMKGDRQGKVDQASTETRGPARPHVLVLASDVLFSHFFSETARARLSEVAEWSQHAGRDDSPQLRVEIAQADVLMTTWHSPFLQMDMFGTRPRVRLIAHCGGEVKSRLEEGILDHVTVTNAAEPMAAPVAEMALALMLALVRRLPDYAAEMRAGVVRTNEYVSSGETVRGRKVGLVDMDALLEELRKARLTVALDVTDPFEPLPSDHELRRIPNALLTPHIAAGGIEMRRAIGAVAVEEVVRFCKGEEQENVVTRDMLATMT